MSDPDRMSKNVRWTLWVIRASVGVALLFKPLKIAADLGMGTYSAAGVAGAMCIVGFPFQLGALFYSLPDLKQTLWSLLFLFAQLIAITFFLPTVI